MLSVNKLTLLHSIRGLAAFYVVVAHAKFALWSGGQAYLIKHPRESWNVLDYLLFISDMLSSNGSAMVIIFYVLSGFFIAYSFDKNDWQLKKFYINRIIRIYVPFISSVIFAILVLYSLNLIIPSVYNAPIKTEFLNSLQEAYKLLNLKSILLSLLFLPNNTQYVGFNFPYWSLLYEGIFYLIAPFVVKHPKGYLIFSSVTLTISFFIPSNAYPLSRFVFDLSFFFALGIFLFGYIKRNEKLNYLKANYLIALLAFIFFSFIIIGVAGWHKVSFVIAGIFACGIIYLFIHYTIQENIFVRFFKKMGMISYTLYLFHFPILILTFGIVHHLTNGYVFYDRIYWVGVIIAVLLSFPIYYLVEHKSLIIISSLKKLDTRVLLTK